jgi:hypothetical protein
MSDDDTTIRYDEWRAGIERAASRDTDLTPDQIRFLKLCRIPSALNKNKPLSYEKIVDLWAENFDFSLSWCSIRRRWDKIVREKL